MTINTTFETLMSGILSTEPLLKGKDAYKPVTLEAARNDVLTRAKETLEIIRTYEGGPLKAPLAWSVRNAIAIKVGYGAKNETLFDLRADDNGKPIKFNRANGLTLEERKAKAIQFFETVIPQIEDGILDDALEAKLQSFRSRAAKGKAKRMGVHPLNLRDAA